MAVVGRLHQRRSMCPSTVLSCFVKEPVVEGAMQSCQNTDGRIYLKATIPSVPEAKKTLTVSSITKGYAPKVLAIDEARNAMIQTGAPFSESDERGAVMGMLGDMQLASIEHIEALIAGGVPDRGLLWLSSNIAEILRSPFLERCGQKERVKKLQGRVGEVQRLCDQLLAYGIPHTLVHSDFHEDNICAGVESGREFSFIDWADCFIGYPLIDYVRITNCGWESYEYENASGLYFEKWVAFEDPERVKEAARLAYPLLHCSNLHRWLLLCEGMDPVDQAPVCHLASRLTHIGDALDEILEGPSPALE